MKDNISDLEDVIASLEDDLARHHSKTCKSQSKKHKRKFDDHDLDQLKGEKKKRQRLSQRLLFMRKLGLYLMRDLKIKLRKKGKAFVPNVFDKSVVPDKRLVKEMEEPIMDEIEDETIEIYLFPQELYDSLYPDEEDEAILVENCEECIQEPKLKKILLEDVYVPSEFSLSMGKSQVFAQIQEAKEHISSSSLSEVQDSLPLQSRLQKLLKLVNLLSHWKI
ncbi:hypothetical protein L6452_06417 [Arctium lappa]|uniref:Uncharacterized protein n=1 Tax=Arctium lappa TaxID=4217 RepID=A0ACB9EJC5_ARCLA|nr:hypothetical protein L6452_06417 [Arctium lappa]